MSTRKSSHRTIFLIVSSGSPLALIASSLRSTSKKPVCHGDHRQPESPKGAQKGDLARPAGFEVGKKVDRKRQILVDTLGLLLSVAIHAPAFRIATGGTGTRPPHTSFVPVH